MTASPADEALMLRFQDQGDAAAFETLFRRHKDAFVSFLWRLSGNESVAEEVSQQCWLKLIELARERRYRAVAGSRFRTWLYTLGRNLYIDRYVRSHGETRRQPLDVLEKVPEGIAHADPFAEAARDQSSSRLAEAIRQLPYEQREVIALWASDFSAEQMSALTGAPRDTVLSRKRYALSRLRKLLDDEDAALLP